MPHRLIKLSDWKGATCDYLISFNNSELREIIHLFDISSRADHNGYIRMCTGNKNQYGALFHYIFHPEEIFLFLITRCKKGWSIKDMCNQVFVGIIAVGVMDGMDTFLC